MGKRVHRLARLSKASRYKGAIYESDGQPVATTNGFVLAVVGAHDLEEAKRIVLQLTPTVVEGGVPLPAVQQIVKVIDDLPSARPGQATITPATEPDAGLIAAARAAAQVRARDAAKRLPDLEKAFSAAETALAEERAAKRRGRIGQLAAAVGAARFALVAARQAAEGEPVDGPALHAIVVAEAHYDLRLIRAALRALGADSGTITVTGGRSAGIVTCPGGIALAMPFLQ